MTVSALPLEARLLRTTGRVMRLAFRAVINELKNVAPATASGSSLATLSRVHNHLAADAGEAVARSRYLSPQSSGSPDSRINFRHLASPLPSSREAYTCLTAEFFLKYTSCQHDAHDLCVKDLWADSSAPTRRTHFSCTESHAPPASAPRRLRFAMTYIRGSSRHDLNGSEVVHLTSRAATNEFTSRMFGTPASLLK